MVNPENAPSSRASDRKKLRDFHVCTRNRAQLLAIIHECTHILRRIHLHVSVFGEWPCISECSHPRVCTCCHHIPQRFVTLTRTKPPCPSYQYHGGLIRQNRSPWKLNVGLGVIEQSFWALATVNGTIIMPNLVLMVMGGPVRIANALVFTCVRPRL